MNTNELQSTFPTGSNIKDYMRDNTTHLAPACQAHAQVPNKGDVKPVSRPLRGILRDILQGRCGATRDVTKKPVFPVHLQLAHAMVHFCVQYTFSNPLQLPPKHAADAVHQGESRQSESKKWLGSVSGWLAIVTFQNSGADKPFGGLMPEDDGASAEEIDLKTATQPTKNGSFLQT